MNNFNKIYYDRYNHPDRSKKARQTLNRGPDLAEAEKEITPMLYLSTPSASYILIYTNAFAFLKGT